MAEPQPSGIHEGASTPSPPKSSKEDAKAAAALSNLDAKDDDSSSKKVDSKALEGAMKNLSVDEKARPAEKKEEPKKAVKVDAQDVNLLVRVSGVEGGFMRIGRWRGLMVMQVSEFEISKAKATEILKAHDGDAVKAMAAFVSAPA
jgi:NACalpha-BTF3-like transcription factor